MAKTIQRYSNILLDLLKGNYTISWALATAIPLHLSSFLPKRILLPDGIKVVLNNPATLYVNIHDEYEAREYNRHKEFVPCCGDIVFDVGAYVGIYALRSAKRVGDDGIVYAFEPNPSAFAYMVTNVKINCTRNIRCFPIALNDCAGTVSFYTTNDINIEASSLFEFHTKKWAKNTSKIDVKADTLDNFITRKGITRIDIAKIDVEGAEEKVLRGAEKAISNGVIERFIIEAHEDVIPANKTIEFLTSSNYQIKYLLRHPSGIKNIIYAKLVK